MFQEPGAPAVSEPKKKIEKQQKIEKSHDVALPEKAGGLTSERLKEIFWFAHNTKAVEPGLFEDMDQARQYSAKIFPERKIMTESEVKKTILESLEKQGVVSHSREGVMLVDLDTLKSFDFEKNLGRDQHLDFDRNRILTMLFEGQKVLSKDDYANGEREPQDLFYFPKNKEDALDVEKIKKSRFYLLLSDLTKIRNWHGADFGKIPSIEKDPENGLDYREALLAVLLYHPKYGAGYRDEKDGGLYIKRSSSNGKHGRISDMARHMDDKFCKEKGVTLERMKWFVGKKLPNLSSREMLLPDDFEKYSQKGREFSEKAGFHPNRFKKAGFDPSRLSMENQKILMELMGEFKDGENEGNFLEFVRIWGNRGIDLLSTFGVDASRRDEIIKLGIMRAGFGVSQFFFRLEGVIDSIKNIKNEVDAFLQEQTKMKDVDLEKICQAYIQTGQELLDEFFQWSKIDREYEWSKLKLDRKHEFWKKAEMLGAKADVFSAKTLLWAEVFHSIQKKHSSKKDTSNEIGVVVPASAIKGKEKEAEDFLYKELWKSFGSQYGVISGDEVGKDCDLRNNIVTEYYSNYSEDRPKLAKALVDSYLKKIDNPEENKSMKVFSLQVDGKVVAHCRFDGEKDGQVYFGSAYVTRYGRGKSIGGYFLTGALNAMGKEHHLHADCVPGEDISGYYVSKQGFVVDEIVQDYKDFGEPFIFHISREKTEDIKKTHYQSISREQIRKDYETNNFSEKDGRIILRYPIQKKVSLEMYPEEMKNRLTELINEKGYVMTGYFSVAGDNPEKEKIVYCALERLDKSGTVSAGGADARGESSENDLE